MLLRGAHETVIATMDHLAVANLLNGDQNKAAQVSWIFANISLIS